MVAAWFPVSACQVWGPVSGYWILLVPQRSGSRPWLARQYRLVLVHLVSRQSRRPVSARRALQHRVSRWHLASAHQVSQRPVSACRVSRWHLASARRALRQVQALRHPHPVSARRASQHRVSRWHLVSAHQVSQQIRVSRSRRLASAHQVSPLGLIAQTLMPASHAEWLCRGWHNALSSSSPREVRW